MTPLVRSRLFIGLIAFTCTEIFAGSSAGPRLYTAWPFLVTYWLYFAHFFFFASLAYYTNRTSLRSLYLWGVLFGLYESWVTKVVWFGYGDADRLGYPSHCVLYDADGNTPSLITNTIGYNYGFCLNESFSMVLFWHPIFGFLFPLTAVALFEPRLRRSFQGLSWFQAKSLSDKFMLFYIIFLVSVILGGVNGGGPHWVILTWIPILSGLWLGYRHLVPTWKELEEPQQLVVLGSKGFKIVTAYLITLYVSFYFFVIPYNETTALGLEEPLFPGTPQKIIVFMMYFLTIGLLYYRGKPAPLPLTNDIETEKHNMLHALRTIVLLSTFISFIVLVPLFFAPILVFLILFFILLLPVLSVGLFLRHGFYWK